MRFGYPLWACLLCFKSDEYWTVLERCTSGYCDAHWFNHWLCKIRMRTCHTINWASSERQLVVSTTCSPSFFVCFFSFTHALLLFSGCSRSKSIVNWRKLLITLAFCCCFSLINQWYQSNIWWWRAFMIFICFSFEKFSLRPKKKLCIKGNNFYTE